MCEVYFSVVMPTYNRADKINKTIESVLNQSFTEFEFIIIDDGSTDHTDEIVKKYMQKDKRVKYIKNDNWGGPARPRNVGIKKSTGVYVAFLDDDDIWYNNKLEIVGKYINNNPKCILFCHNEDYVFNGKLIRFNNYGPYPENMYETLLFKKNMVSTSATTVNRAVLIESGGFSEDKNIISVEDYDLWIRIAKLGRFKHIPETLGQYIVTETGDNISRSLLSHSRASLNVISRNLSVWEKDHPNDTKVKKRKSSAFFKAALLMSQARDWKYVKYYTLMSIKNNPLNFKPYLILPAIIIKKMISKDY